jgi:formylglycine-generating enzyme required for sulfatase activity
MSDTYTDVQITIQSMNQAGVYPVKAELEDGSGDSDEIRFNRRKLLAAEHRGPRPYTEELTRQLFTARIRAVFDQAAGQARERTAGRLRVRLLVDPGAGELHAVRWECLAPGVFGGEAPLATATLTPFSRFTLLPRRLPPPVTEPPVKLLIAVSNPENLPPDLKPVDVEGHLEMLRVALRELKRTGTFEITVVPGRTGLSPTLQARLEEEGYRIEQDETTLARIVRLLPGYHVLHFLGHGYFKRQNTGGGTAALYLEKPGGWQPTKDEEIVPMLGNLDPQPLLIFLAACGSAVTDASREHPFVGLGPKLVRAGIPAVVAMQDMLPMDVAARLASYFYRRLLDHGLVDRALNEARNTLFRWEDTAWMIPVLFARLQGNRLFDFQEGDLARELVLKPFEPETVYIPTGPFLMGADPGDGIPEYEAPQHAVAMLGYRIGKYPVTNRQYAEFIRREKAQDVPKDAGWFLREPPADRLDHPVTGVSWFDAVAYCRWLGRQSGRRYRLPTEAEWEKAAAPAPTLQNSEEGLGERATHLTPWGPEWSDGMCNVNGTGTTPVTAHSHGASRYGCEDILGNAQEWTATLWGTRPGEPQQSYRDRADGGPTVTDPADLPAQARMVHRGGSYRSQPGDLRCSARASAPPDSAIPWRGFRVAMDV